MNAQKFTKKALEALGSAQNIAIENQNMQVMPEHLLYALVDQDGGLIPNLLRRTGTDTDKLLAMLDSAISKMPAVSGSGREPDKIYICSRARRGTNTSPWSTSCSPSSTMPRRR